MTVFCTSSVLSCALIANAASSCPTDLDQDGSTGFTDLVSLLGSWDTPEGDIEVNPEMCRATKDRSWGMRGVGEPEAGAVHLFELVP